MCIRQGETRKVHVNEAISILKRYIPAWTPLFRSTHEREHNGAQKNIWKWKKRNKEDTVCSRDTVRNTLGYHDRLRIATESHRLLFPRPSLPAPPSHPTPPLHHHTLYRWPFSWLTPPYHAPPGKLTPSPLCRYILVSPTIHHFGFSSDESDTLSWEGKEKKINKQNKRRRQK